MFKQSVFSLSGIGYFRHVICENGKGIARIDVINTLHSGKEVPDEILILCHTKDNDLLQRMSELTHFLQQGKTVILNFDISYFGFLNCHAGMTDEDPAHIVHLQGQLTKLGECYVDGVKNHRTINSPVLENLVSADM